jgi:hypothetical protein
VAIPALLDQLVLTDSIMTMDAMGYQRAIAERILARGGDYLLTLKANHPSAQAAVAAHFEEHCFGSGTPAPQGSRMGLASNNSEHVIVIPGGLLAPTAQAGLTVAIGDHKVEGDFT